MPNAGKVKPGFESEYKTEREILRKEYNALMAFVNDDSISDDKYKEELKKRAEKILSKLSEPTVVYRGGSVLSVGDITDTPQFKRWFGKGSKVI